MSEDATPSFREQTMNRLAEERGNRVEEPAPENVKGTAPEVIEDEPIGTPEHDTEDPMSSKLKPWKTKSNLWMKMNHLRRHPMKSNTIGSSGIRTCSPNIPS